MVRIVFNMLTAVLIAIIVSVLLTIDFKPTIKKWNQKNLIQKSTFISQ